MSYNNLFNFSENYFVNKIKPELNNQIKVVFINVFIIQLLIFTSCLYVGFYLYHRQQVEIMSAEEIEYLQLAPLLLTEDFETIADDLLLIQVDDYIGEYIKSPTDTALQRLKERFTFFSKSRPMYHQVRFINENGEEIIRINNKNGQTKLLVDQELQNKSQRYYFKETKKLGTNEIFVSPLDLNIEYGKIEIPKRPTIRFGVPVFAKTGENKGVILLNYDIGQTLAEFKKHFVSTDSIQYSITTFDGLYILSQQLKKEFDSQYSFNEEHPEMHSMISQNKKFQIKNDEGIYTITSFKPLSFMKKYLSNSSKEINIKGIEGDATQMKVIVISQILNGYKFNFFAFQSFKLFLLYLIIQIALAIRIWFFIQNRILKKELSVWMEFFFQGIEKNPSSILLTDQNRQILYTNKKFLDLTGYSEDEVYLQNTNILKSGEMSPAGYKNLWDTLSSGKTWSGEFHNKTKSNTLYWVYTSITPIFNKNGEIVRYLGIQEDISVQKQLQKQLEKRAATDSLTGLENRHSFFSKMSIEIERSLRGEHDFSLLMMDIDNFKNINDQFGHQVGDEVLKDLSKLLTQTIRAVDICARYGGEEFIIVMPETNLCNAKISAERIRKMVEQCTVKYNKLKIKYTLSIGMTQWNGKEEIDETIARADLCLYKAKNTGRNRIIHC